MSRLDEIISNLQKGDTYFQSDRDITAKSEVKILMLEILVESLRGDTVADMGDIFRKEVREL